VAPAAPDEQRPVRQRRLQVSRLLELTPDRHLDAHQIATGRRAHIGLIADKRPTQVERRLHQFPHLRLPEVAVPGRQSPLGIRTNDEPSIPESLHRQMANPFRIGYGKHA
jgi:hypothetical protein